MEGVSFLFVINPVAGNHKIRKFISEIESKLECNEINYKIEYTIKKGHVAEILRDVDRIPQEVIVAVGGDGTVNEVINCLVGSKKVLGIIPCGTGNDLAKSLNIPKNPIDALEVLLMGEPSTVDLGKAGNHFFTNVASIGLDAEIANCANKMKKRFSGTKAYILALLKVLTTFRSFPIEIMVNGNVFKKEVMLVAVCNGGFYGGGMKIAPDASVLDGLLDICVIEKMSKIKLLLLFPSVYKGSHKKFREVIYYKTDKLIIKSSNYLVNLDGEIYEVEDGTTEFSTNCPKIQVIMNNSMKTCNTFALSN